MSISKEQMRDIYTRMCRIRAFETAAKDLFAEGKIYGFAHLYLGEEAIAPAVCECLREDDFITSTHRGHGELDDGRTLRPLHRLLQGQGRLHAHR